jgi:hypothetical protein
MYIKGYIVKGLQFDGISRLIGSIPIYPSFFKETKLLSSLITIIADYKYCKNKY